MSNKVNDAWTRPPVEVIPRTALRPSEAAISLGISERTLADWQKLEGFPVVRIGGCKLLPVAELRAWLSQRLAAQEDAA